MNEERSQRPRDVLVYVVGRPLLLVLWSLVAWGSVYGLALLRAVVARGPVALRQALSRDGAGGVVNVMLAGLAVLVWGVVGVVVWRRRRGPRGSRRRED